MTGSLAAWFTVVYTAEWRPSPVIPISTTSPCIVPISLSSSVLFSSINGLFPWLYRRSYMSAHVLLNLLNELGKRDKMRGLPSILSLFCNEFNKFNTTRPRMLNSFYHMTNTLKSHFCRKNVIILSLCTQRCYGLHNLSRKSINH